MNAWLSDFRPVLSLVFDYLELPDLQKWRLGKNEDEARSMGDVAVLCTTVLYLCGVRSSISLIW